MPPMDNAPFFSIIIATRDRPELCHVALRSVLEQSFSNREIIVVIDGSSGANLAKYRELEKQFDTVVFVELEHRPNGHGQCYCLNHGVSKSSGRYLCFLDDDDYWTDATYLEDVFNNITASGKLVDLHFSHQKAVYSDGIEKQENVWIEDLIPQVRIQNKNHGDSYFVDAEFLMSSVGFAHQNCSVFRRDFFLSLKGMDEGIYYENDRDIYLRSVDAAKAILFSTRYMSVHNIPDASKRTNFSMAKSAIEKKLTQIHVYDKGIALCRNPHVVRFCCRAKNYELKNTAHLMEDGKQYKGAAHYAREALLGGFNFRWLAYTLYLTLLGELKPNDMVRDDYQ